MVYRRGRYYKTVLESNSQDHPRRKTKGVTHFDSRTHADSEKAIQDQSSSPSTANVGIDETYQVPIEVYEELEKATPEERTEIVLRLIERHPHGRLELSASEERRVNLQGINLNRDMLKTRCESLTSKPCWWSSIFRGANLRSADLHDVNLRDADLQGANLQNANLQGAFLEDAQLQDATLRGAKLQGATLQGTNLQGANLQHANLENADLMGANLENADLRYSNLQGAKLDSAILRNANLTIANLRGSNLRQADLKYARLQETCLQGSSLIGTHLEGAYLWHADLQDTDMESARLQDAFLDYANLQGATLMGAQLQRASLQDTHLDGVDLSRCTLDNAFFYNTWLDRTRLGWDQIRGAIGEEIVARVKEQDMDTRAQRFKEAKQGYLILKQNFDDLGDYDASSRAYRKERRMEKFEAYYWARFCLLNRNWKDAANYLLKSLGDQIVEVLCDYGESVGRVVGWIAALLLIIGPVFVTILGGLRWSVDGAQHLFSLMSPVSRFIYSFFQYLLYILDAFTTASFSQLEPINDGVRLVSGLIAFFGIVLAGLLGFVAGNRIRRS